MIFVNLQNYQNITQENGFGHFRNCIKLHKNENKIGSLRPAVRTQKLIPPLFCDVQQLAVHYCPDSCCSSRVAANLASSNQCLLSEVVAGIQKGTFGKDAHIMGPHNQQQRIIY